MPPFKISLTASTTQGFTEPLSGLGQAIPLEMLLIHGGTFTMGSPSPSDESAVDNEAEGPQHTVTVPTFFMGRYPVTQAQWRAVARMTQVNIELEAKSPGFFEGEDDYPVERVDWYEAIEFCDRLTHYYGRPYRLPSEAEWEYACRAGTTTPFAFGKILPLELANYRGDYEDRGKLKKRYREPTPVNYFGVANAWGLCDMHGNVSEWCSDHWHETYEGAPVDGSVWLLSDEDKDRVPCEDLYKRVYRSGGCDYSPGYCRSAHRDCLYTNLFSGFRVVCSAL